MEVLKVIQAILTSLAAILIALAVLIAVIKGKNLNIEKMIGALTSLLQRIPPIRHQWTTETQEQIEQICRHAEAIERNTSLLKGNTSPILTREDAT